jgi:hypothetical protein
VAAVVAGAAGLGRVVQEGQQVSAYRLAVTGTGRLAAAGDQRTMAVLYRVPGAQMHYDGPAPWLSVPPTRQAVMCLEAAGAPSDVSARYIEERARLMSPEAEAMRRWLAARPAMLRPLLAHQDDFCAWAFGMRGAINASEQGTGKTIMAAALIGAWRATAAISRVLIVAPKSPLRQWEDELYGSLPEAACPVFIPLDRAPVPQRQAVVDAARGEEGFFALAVNYEVLRAMAPTLVAWRPDVLVLDESWKIKTPNAEVTKAAFQIAEASRRVLCLNGTLYSNNVGDAWSQYRVAAGANMAGRYTHWMRDYAESREIRVGARTITKYTGVADPVGLMNRLAPVYWRATKASCLDLPEKLAPVRVALEMPRGQRAAYEAVRADGEAGLDPDAPEPQDAPVLPEEWDAAADMESAVNLSLAGAITKVLRLQQVTSGFLPGRLTYDTPWDGSGWGRLDEESGVWRLDSPKLDWLRGWLHDTMAGDPHVRAIVWCRFNADVAAVARLAEAILGDHAVARVVGGRHGVKDKALDGVKESFNSRDPEGVRLIAAQTKRLAYGHNLQACDWNVLYSHSWSYLERDQLEDRSHRIGRVGPVGYVELVCTRDGETTVDHEVLAATEAKEHMAERLARDTTRTLERL